MTAGSDERRLIYERVCESYRAIDDFRTKLLGLLPLATGAGALLLIDGEIKLGDRTPESAKAFLGAIGAFGLVITLGLFAFKLHGIKKCGIKKCHLFDPGRPVPRGAFPDPRAILEPAA